MTFVIRSLEPGDEAQWTDLWTGQISFHGETPDPAVAQITWRRLLDPDHPFWGLIAVDGETVLGIANHVTHASTWSVEPEVYLEDLYVSEAARGRGVGKALILEGMARAKVLGAAAFHWEVDPENKPARALYDKLTGGPEKWVKYNIDL